jgi:hypothetical protein
MVTHKQINTAIKICNIFELGKPDTVYNYAEALQNYATSGVTVSSQKFCTKTGDLLQVLVILMGQNRHHPLLNYITPIQKSMKSWFYSKFRFPKKAFIVDWVKYGNDKEVKKACDTVYYARTIEPAINKFKDLGLSHFWIFTAFIDTILVHGNSGFKQIIDATSHTQNEFQFLKNFTASRINYIINFSNLEKNKSMSRPNIILKWAEANWLNQDGPYFITLDKMGDFVV